jgi:hypothetical protein
MNIEYNKMCVSNFGNTIIFVIVQDKKNFMFKFQGSQKWRKGTFLLVLENLTLARQQIKLKI